MLHHWRIYSLLLAAKGFRPFLSRKMIQILNEKTIQLNLPSKIGYERVAMECSASFAKLAGFLSERIEDLKTAVSEACLNAIEHGNQGRTDARVIITINRGKDDFSVTVFDEGKGIKEFPQLPDIKKKVENLERPDGLGLFLIQQLVDHVEFNQMDIYGHSVRMVIKLEK